MAIIISRNGKDAQRIDQQPITDESYLQKYVSENPNALPLDDLAPDARLLVVGREFPTRSGPIDILAVDRTGGLYIIETKLFKNPDKRRVVAQVLDYGASLWTGYGDGEGLVRDIDQFMAETGAGGLAQQLSSVYDLDETGTAEAVAKLKRSLVDGNIKFLVLMDRLHEALRDLILFINAKSRFDIYAVEMEFYSHGGLEIVIPRLFGAEVKKEVTDSRGTDPKYTWDEERFLKEAERTLKPNEFAAVQRLCEFSKKVATATEWKCLTFHAGGKCNVTIAGFGKRRLYSVDTEGTLLLDFQQPEKAGAGRELRDRFKAALVAARFPKVRKNESGKLQLDIGEWMDRLPVLETTIAELLGSAARPD